MRRALSVLVFSALMAGGGLAKTPPKSVHASASKVIPVEELRFYKNRQGLTVAKAWGDPDTGPHSNFIRMPGHAKSGLHTHRFSYYGVVVKGELANAASESTAAQTLRPGSYWVQKGGEPHVTDCLSETECLIFVTSKGPFDFHPVAAPGDGQTALPKR